MTLQLESMSIEMPRLRHHPNRQPSGPIASRITAASASSPASHSRRPRHLPAIRHLISSPAGLFQMNFLVFSVTTIAGAGLFNGALAWFGMRVIGDQPALMHDPDALRKVLSSKSEWLIGFALVVAALYALMIWMQRRAAARRGTSAAP